MGSQKLTEAQVDALREIAVLRPVAGNDDGWVLPVGTVRRPTIEALARAAVIEPRDGGDYIGTVGGRYWRVSATGRAYLATLDRERGDG